jgi:site-specific DNA-methyltransferase (adenine-specific)
VKALDEQTGTLTSGEGSIRQQKYSGYHGGDGVTGNPEVSYGDSGGASRFFPQFQAAEADVPFYYTAKASTAERTVGLDERSIHPTMKPVDLMRWLVRLATPPGGLVLDPFTGSGSTGVAAMLEGGGFRFLGIEREPEYVAIAEQRIKHVAGGRWRTPEQVAAEAALLPEGKKKQLTLF